MIDKVIMEELRKVIGRLTTSAETAAQSVERRGYDALARDLRLPAVAALILLDVIDGKPVRVVTPEQYAKGYVTLLGGFHQEWRPYTRVYNLPDGNFVVVEPYGPDAEEPA